MIPSDLARARRDPVAFTEEVLKVTLLPWQKEALRAMAAGRPVHVHPVRASGKRFMLEIVERLRKEGLL